MIVWCRGYLSRAIGISGIFLVVGGAIILSNKDCSRRHEAEIERLSATCPPAEVGEQLVSTIRQLRKDSTASIRCIYTSNTGYGRSTRIRPAVPGRAS